MNSQEYQRYIAETAASFVNDPLGYILWCFKWDTEPTLQRTKLVSPYKEMYPNCEYGPDLWACEVLAAIKNHLESGVETPCRIAVASGHGIGKTALTSWLAKWAIETSFQAKGTVIARTADQLSTKTWAELSKWHQHSLTYEFFKYNNTKGNMYLASTNPNYKSTWRIDARTCQKGDEDSFQGQHGFFGGRSIYLIDEASKVQQEVFDVAEGSLLSSKGSLLICFGNPTENSGRFYDCFHKDRQYWYCFNIDSRDVQISNKSALEKQILMNANKDGGNIDCDENRIRIFGQFPRRSSTQMIGAETIKKAIDREPEFHEHGLYKAMVGVDVARFGDDVSVIATRIHKNGRYELKKFAQLDNISLARKIVEHVQELKELGLEVEVLIDGNGVGSGVVDAMRSWGYHVHDVLSQSAAGNAKKYANKRAEMWGKAAEWLESGALSDDPGLSSDLQLMTYRYNNADKILLTDKATIKKEYGRSPDCADAFCLTFAENINEISSKVNRFDRTAPMKSRKDYDPHAAV